MPSELKRISVVTGCFNEEENVKELYEQVKAVFQDLPQYEYEHIFIDNASKDETVAILREIANHDHRVKIIVNTRNFGHIRSPHHALMQAKGNAVISIVADLQDPPIMIKEFIRKWEEGYKIVIGVKTQSEESPIFYAIRKGYYNLVARLSEVELIKNFTGFGLYDQKVIETLRSIEDPYPYFRGLICDIGFERAVIEYKQPSRKRGFTKNNFYVLYDIAMLGITNHSKVPLRLATMTGFTVALFSLLVALGYFIYKLIFWNSFSVGIAPLVIGLFFFSSVQLFFIGIIGEYIGSIHTQVLKRPLVIEKERINFD
ncbi:dolichol monophosphate mannose synthase [Smithella sp. SCADC]|jgi:glycosyltransferase involved in cell wall biosynthesis|nr:dolichol monophosphate mannose synthase [Smithella sp. SCADC]